MERFLFRFACVFWAVVSVLQFACIYRLNAPTDAASIICFVFVRSCELRGSVAPFVWRTCVCSCVCAAFLLSRVQTHTNTHTHHTIPLSLPFHIHSYIHFTSSHFTHTPERGTTTTRYFTLTFISHSSHTPERGHHHPIGDRDIHRYSQRFFTFFTHP